jgi:hypothetical protein
VRESHQEKYHKRDFFKWYKKLGVDSSSGNYTLKLG